MEILFILIVLVFSIIIHEVAHGGMADALGDHTARNAGRLTFNPINHFDFMGSFLVPLLCVILPTRFVFGWAKPVPINPYNFRDQKYGSLKVSFAGPGSNLLVASFFGILGRFLPLTENARILIFNSFTRFIGDFKVPETLTEFGFPGMVFFLFLIIIFINVLLAVVNLTPIPPLDGSHIFFTFFPKIEAKFKNFAASSGILVLPLLFISIYFLLPYVFMIVFLFFRFIAGV
jgi:Zn-dependent protease